MLQDLPLRKSDQTVPKDMLYPILLGIGANLDSIAGSPKATVLESFRELERSALHVCAISKLYQTPAFPSGSGPDYVNAAALCKSNLDPKSVLEIFHRIEEKFGRARRQRWGARTLDIDLLAVGDNVLPNRAIQKKWRELLLVDQQSQVPDQLILPHPRLQDRAFVLLPLAEIAPDWVHPVLGLSVTDMLAALPPARPDGAMVD